MCPRRCLCFHRRCLLPPLPLLDVGVIGIGDGGNCDKRFLAKEAAAVVTAAREIILRIDVQNNTLVKVIF